MTGPTDDQVKHGETGEEMHQSKPELAAPVDPRREERSPLATKTEQLVDPSLDVDSSKTELVPSETLPRQHTQARWRYIFRTAWRLAGGTDPVGTPKREWLDDMLQAVDQHLAAPPKSGILGDDPDVVSLQVGAQLRDAGEFEARDFTVAVLVPTLRNLEAKGLGSQEQKTDMITASLIKSPSLLNASALQKLVAKLWKYMQSQEHRSPGYYTTLVALAQLLSRESSPKSKRQGAWYYHYLLCLGPETMGPDGLETAANNLAAAISDIARKQHEPGKEPKEVTLS